MEAASALPDAGPCEVRLGHAALTAAALQFAALPGGRDAREAAQQLLASAATASLADSAARAKRWPAIRSASRHKVQCSVSAQVSFLSIQQLMKAVNSFAWHWINSKRFKCLVEV